MFAVVEWMETKEVSVIPASWLIHNDSGILGLWPPSTMKSTKREKAVKKMVEPESSWSKFPVRIIRNEGNFSFFIMN